ncbi:MAG: ABC transporter permease [Actinomycetia bacterium]|nr:ABC transporter permease [Actinomycetes bacterium]MCQ3805289.1 ABC transporter permease [Acidimicrobiia bacterium]MCY4648903.1 ABC transporter permease [bacterium]
MTAKTGKRRLDSRLVVGLIMFGIMVAVAILAPWIARNDPLAIDFGTQFLAPSADHWFGTGRLGFDIFARVVYAARYDLVIAMSAVAFSIVIGHPIGLFVGYMGGRIDSLTMRGLDVIQSFPAFVLAVGVLAALGEGVLNLILVVGFVGIPTFVRLVRAEVRSLREHSYVEAGRAVGNSKWQILLRYIAPGTVGTVVTQAAISCGWAILLTAALGFIGLGVPLPEPEWGAMIADGVDEMVVGGRWWISVFPGMAIAFTIFSLSLIGESIADLVEPTRRKSR